MPSARSSFEKVLWSDIIVLWNHGPTGLREHMWYVRFEKDGNVLTRVPFGTVSDIVTGLAAVLSRCRCSHCVHPLVQCAPESPEIASHGDWERAAVRRFAAFRADVHARGRATSTVAEDNAERTLAEDNGTATETSTEMGTCAICLEDDVEALPRCTGRVCAVKVCKVCPVHRNWPFRAPSDPNSCTASRCATNVRGGCAHCATVPSCRRPRRSCALRVTRAFRWGSLATAVCTATAPAFASRATERSASASRASAPRMIMGTP